MPQIFKRIALFSPGGDIVYCINTSNTIGGTPAYLLLYKNPNLLRTLYLLTPCYAAAIDHLLDPHICKICTFAEAYPGAIRYHAILKLFFKGRSCHGN